MENLENTQQESASSPQSTPAPVPTSTPVVDASTSNGPEGAKSLGKEPKAKRSLFPVLIAFLLGALIYALLGMGYNLYAQDRQASLLADAIVQDIAKTDGISLSTPATKPANSSSQDTNVDPKELANYVKSEDCTKNTQYSKYKLVNALMQVKSIGVYDGLQIYAGGGGVATLKWSDLPPVVDYQCKPIQLSDIKVGDRVNTYSYSPTGLNTSETYLIQRAVK